MRSFYSSNFEKFLNDSEAEVLGMLATNNGFDLNDLQKNTWLYEIKLLKEILKSFDSNGKILFEYTIPRIGKRIDNVLLINNIVFLLEFKVGENTYNRNEIDQVLDYALDLKNFHKESHDKLIVPILVCSSAHARDNNISAYEDKIIKPLLCNSQNLQETILRILENYYENSFDYNDWENSPYLPTPTIIEAAQALYSNHNVEEILYPAMEDYTLDFIIGKGPSAKNVQLPLPKFTLIGATTRAGMLSSPLRDRFGLICRLETYSVKELTEIVSRAAVMLGVDIEPFAAQEIAKRSRGTPRIANRLLKRVRDYSVVKKHERIILSDAQNALKMLEIDELGLDSIDIRPSMAL